MKAPLIWTTLSFVTAFIAFSGTAANAQSEATVLLNSADAPFIHHYDFDALALDFTVQSSAGDALKTLTIAKQGTAREGIDFTKVVLWADQGVAGFQGWGYDKQLAEGTLVNGLWVFTGFEHVFKQSSQRYFVSVESGPFVKDKTGQFGLLQGGDDGDGAYETGEQGIFLASGVIVSVPTSAYSHTLLFKDQNGDFLGPKAYIKNVSVEQSAPTYLVAPNLPIVFTGEARDRNNGTTQSVKLAVNGQELAATSVNGDFFAEWTASYTPAFLKEELAITLSTLDGNGRTWTSEAFYLIIDQRVPSVFESQFNALPGSIQADATDSAELTLTLRDSSGDPLPMREVTFGGLRASIDVLSLQSVTTDASGKARVILTSSASGIAQISAFVGTMKVGEVAVTVGEQAPQPDPTPIEDIVLPGDLIKGSLSTVYYYGTDGKRHVFVHQDIYFSWYGDNFSAVRTISDERLASIALGSPVPFKPGSLIKVPSVPAVYVVDVNQTLRHISSESLANTLFGSTWNKQVRDLSEALLTTYTFGDPVDSTGDFNAQELDAMMLSIDDELAA